MNINENEDLEVSNNENQNEVQQTSSDFKASRKEATKKIQERLSKSSIKNASKQTVLRALMPIITYVALFIIAVIIIIGIAMFFITMPGMAIEKIKELANTVGNAVASWFGADTTKQVEDVEIYESLEYLEQMGYDLKGYGFLTGYVGDSNDGVERDDNDKITNAESDFIASYLISDNYVYTIKNFNINTDTWYGAIGAHLASLFTGGESNKYWSRGMIDIWLDGGVIGQEHEYYDVYNLGKIEIDAGKKTMEIKRGWFNNSMTYNLDGWTGRYGMPVDFLISVHLATMMPDLAYDIATSFETVIKLLLHPVDGEGNTATGYYQVAPNTYRSYDQFEEYAGIGVNKEEAYEIMKEFGIESPDNCIGLTDVEPNQVIPTKTLRANLKDDYKTETVSNYSTMMTALKEYGYTGELSDSITYDDFYSKLSDVSDIPANYSQTNEYGGDSGPIVKDYTTSESWEGTYEGESCYFTADIKFGYNNYWYSDGSGGMIICEYTYIQYSVSRDLTQSEIEAIKAENEVNNIEELKCSERMKSDTTMTKVCESCRQYIAKIYSNIKDVDVSNLKIYQPYISRVENHWYRDVYFVADKNEEFVDYDYDYEALMKERWTLYETYTESDGRPDLIGEYKLYKTDGTPYYGTAEEAAKENIRVTKKAETINIGDEATDLNWHEIDGKLTAYEENSGEQDFYQVYPDVTPDDANYDIKTNIYVNVNTNGGITQTGEGQRKETNSTIKKMFLENSYFRYDGTAERAEIITALRDQNDIDYGSLDSTELSGTAEVDGKTYKVSDYAGQVSLNQDSLNAFSMLENEHTLDADYIYRDFKELIVELGYFEKEELTDETPRLLQWLIPETGSNGYPMRAIDKNENEYGSMIHSEGDINVIKEQTIAAKLKEFLEEETESDNEPQMIIDDETDLQNVSGISNVSMISSITLGNSVGSLDGDTDPSKVSVEEFLTAAAEIHARMEGTTGAKRWEYCAAGNHSGDATRHTEDGSCPGNYGTYEEANANGKTADCSSYVSWVLQEVGIITSKYNTTGMYTALAEYILTKEEAGELQPGDIVLTEEHVQINGEDNTQYNAGSTSAIQGAPTQYVPNYTHVIRLPFSGTTQNEDPYSGYKGNEAVVSPVTGILLEYGTYNGETDNVSGDEYRVNTDLKYGTGLLNFDDSNSDPNNTNSQSNDTKIQIDHVGYAKILVLDKENYEILENELLSSTRWTSKFLNSNGNYKELQLTEDEINDESNPWSDADKTLYGCKEFAEIYEKAGISGNIIYIDGFKCELPEEDYDIEENIDKVAPDGEDIDITYFETTQISDFGSDGNISNEDDLLDALYEKDDEYKLASQSATDKLNSESIVKEDAVSSLYVNGIRLIKEGTVIGRTMTDKELIESRNDNYSDYRKTSGSSDDFQEKVVGNYIRIMMRNLDKTVVENIEDYMKLDDGSKGQEGIYGDLEAIDENSTDAEKIRAAVTYFMSMGFTKEAACGILGNLIQESGLDPAIVSSAGYHGLVQWDSAVRWPKVKDWMASQGYNEDSYAGQIRAIYEFEINQMDQARWEELKKLTDVEKAAELFCVYNERCVGGNDEPVWYKTGSLYQQLNLRKQFAHNAYDIYMGDDNKGIKDGA